MVYKGIQKKMIVLRHIDSQFFEQACFILRGDGLYNDCSCDENGMAAEAARIIAQMDAARGSRSAPEKPDTRKGGGLRFIYGLLSGVALTLVLFAIIR